jgi:hypothetical protein
VAQFEDLVIPIFEATHKDEQGRPLVGVFLFDNSKCHGIMAPDALVANLMNVNPGGAQPKMRDGWYVNAAGERVAQNMCFAVGDTVRVAFKDKEQGKAAEAGMVVESTSWLLGVPKGMKQVILSLCQRVGVFDFAFVSPLLYLYPRTGAAGAGAVARRPEGGLQGETD